tara:strand:- start:318 stop:752 length:435 start_codon:yes stop_codon:yes gene_type:complete
MGNIKSGTWYKTFYGAGIETLTAAKTLTAQDTGTVYVINVAGAKVFTLPEPSANLWFKFVIGATEPTTTHTVVTNGSSNIIEGQIGTSEDAAGSVSTAADSDTISFVANKAIHGDWVSLWCDGTNWYIDGMCKVQDGMTTTQAS